MAEVVSNYREVQRKLATLDPELRKEMNSQLRALSVEAVAIARGRASWSRQIPAAIVPTVTTLGAGVRVKKSTPIAVLNERPSGQWRHPVFGNTNVWVTQQARPSVRPAVEEEAGRLKEIAVEIMREAERKAGFH